MSSARKVTLLSSDSRLFEVEERIVRLCPYIDGLYTGGKTPRQPLIMEGITGELLDRVLHWVSHHQDDSLWVVPPTSSIEDLEAIQGHLPSMPRGQGSANVYASRGTSSASCAPRSSRSRRPGSSHRSSSSSFGGLPIPEWDRAFLNAMDNSTLYGVITAAHYLKLSRLRNLACTVVAHRLNTMNSRQLMHEFGLSRLLNGGLPGGRHRGRAGRASLFGDAQVQVAGAVSAGEPPGAANDDDIRLLSIDQSRRGY